MTVPPSLSFASHTIASSPSFQSVFNAALDEYTKHTGNDLTNHPLSIKIESWRSPGDVLGLLQEQAEVFREFREGNKKLMKVIEPTVNVLCSLSGAFSDNIGLAYPPASAIFGGVSILFLTAKSISTSYDALVDLFDCIGNFLKRLEIHRNFTPGITEIAVKVLAELLSVLGLATKQMKMGRFTKFGRKLLGEGDTMAVLRRLDRLTQEEAQVTVAQTLEVVQGLVSNMKVVMDNGKVSTEGIRQALVAMQEATENIHKMRRDQLQQNVRDWLSAPDPSTNHNEAWGKQHLGTAEWFIEGRTFNQWKARGSTLCIYGKPGSGKSVICSKIIGDLENMRRSGLALVPYFYFDFKDTDKQNRRALLSSLLVQLCARSDPFYDILSRLYSSHDHGTRQPSNDSLMHCLKEMLSLPGQGAVYIVMDALDECPNKPGMPSPREEVLKVIEQLVGLRLPSLRLCITSRPEVDIRNALGPLTSHPVSLHEECGQRKDIIDYIKSVVRSDPRMRRWRDEEKNLVIESLSEKVAGMFRWVYCQLETLRRCFPPSIRQTLEELPATLDETYERALLGIDNEKREYAERFFQCLAVSVRPLRAEELAEAIVVNLKTEAGPTFDAGWRPQDPEEAVLRTCSSLITITEIDGSRVVQFSHFSVKEWLVSSRLVTRGGLSRYHIVPQTAHTTLARICLGVLLQLDKRLDKRSIKNSPLAQYAAQHWVEHALFEDVSTYIDREMECLFDPEKPHFAAWVWVYDLDPSRKRSMVTSHPTTPEASPLHYVALCGLLDLVERLVASRPGDIHALDKNGRTPLHAALYGGHTEVAQFLLSCGASRDAWDDDDWTPMHIASQCGNLDIVRLLLQKKVDLNTETKGDRQTPLDLALHNGNPQVVRFLLEHGANVNTRDDEGLTPLHIAFQRGDVEASRLLLERGANVNARRTDRQTPLHLASWAGELEFTSLFLDHRANVNARGDRNRTPLLMALGNKELEIMRLLLDHGADVNVKGEWDDTPLHLASENGDVEIMSLLLDHGADVDARDCPNRTPLHMALGSANPERIVQTLLEHEADANAADIEGRTPLHMASKSGKLEVVRLLLEHGADVNAPSENNSTPLHVSSSAGHLEIAELLLENEADAKARTNGGTTPLHIACMRGWLEVAQLLFEYGADVNDMDEDCWTPLHFAVEYNWDEPKVALWLVEYVEADVNSRDNDGCTPLHCALVKGNHEVVRSLVKRGADVYARDNNDQTPLQLVQEGGYFAFEAEDCWGGMSTSE